MTYVKAKIGEPIEALLKRLKRAVEKSGILTDVKRHDYYEKPSVRKNKKQIEARKRESKRLKKLERALERKCTNQNFKWNKDHTQKILLPPPRPYKGGSSRPSAGGKKPYRGNSAYRGNSNRTNTPSGNTNRNNATSRVNTISKPTVNKDDK